MSRQSSQETRWPATHESGTGQRSEFWRRASMERWWRLSGHHGGAAVILATRRGWPAVRPRGGFRQQNPSRQHTKKILTVTVALYVSLSPRFHGGGRKLLHGACKHPAMARLKVDGERGCSTVFILRTAASSEGSQRTTLFHRLGRVRLAESARFLRASVRTERRLGMTDHEGPLARITGTRELVGCEEEIGPGMRYGPFLFFFSVISVFHFFL
jgi:hypothetical protein